MDTENKKLYRLPKSGILAGVSAGLGEYFSVDPVLVRILFVFLALIHGLGILLYLILIFVIPKKPEEEEAGAVEKLKGIVEHVEEGSQAVAEKIKKRGWLSNTKRVIGLAIIVIGVVVLLNNLFPVRWFRWDVFWPTALIVTGIYLVFKRERQN